MWFGVVYFGSLLTLLWQGFYTFDDFTMSVTPDLTLANLQALFNPANYDIILRTLTMAIAVTIASAILAFPMAWYMARYTSGKMKAFTSPSCCQCGPAISSKPTRGRCCWLKTAWRSGFNPSRAGADPDRVSDAASRGREYAVDVRIRAFSGFRLHLATFMILPVQAALERLPPSLLQASADLAPARVRPSAM